MKTQEFTGTILIREKSYQVSFKISIEPQNYLYISIAQRQGLHLTIIIEPFTSQMLEHYGYKLEEGITYEFSGNHIGFINSGQRGSEGVWDSWDLNRVSMKFQYFKDGVCLTFCGNTERGCSTWLGSLDPKTVEKHDPLDFSIIFFVPIEKLVEFLTPEKTKISENEKNIKFVEQLKESKLPNYN